MNIGDRVRVIGNIGGVLNQVGLIEDYDGSDYRPWCIRLLGDVYGKMGSYVWLYDYELEVLND